VVQLQAVRIKHTDTRPSLSDVQQQQLQTTVLKTT